MLTTLDIKESALKPSLFEEAANRKLWEEVEVSPIGSCNNILLGALRDGRLRVYKPLSVIFNSESGSIIAEASEIDEFGYGQTMSEALADLQRAIAELYFSLESDQARLGADLRRVWEEMSTRIHRVEPAYEIS